MTSSMNCAWLVPVGGPPIRPIELNPKPAELLLGRQDNVDIRLINDAVSRVHARIALQSGQWHLTDLGSRWGTYVNGVRIAAERPIPLHPGDLVRINPWTFNFSAEPSSRLDGVESVDDAAQMQTLVRPVNRAQGMSTLPGEMLTLLIEAASALHNATDETMLADALVDAAVRGSGLPNGFVMTPLDANGRLNVLASRQASGVRPTFSRSLISVASGGVVSTLAPSGSHDEISQSMVALRIDAALCVPLSLGTTVAGYLYLDARGGRFAPSREQWSRVSSFCVALGRIASLALANLKRLEIERRSARVDAGSTRQPKPSGPDSTA